MVGCAMTYSLFECAKDSIDELMPNDLLHSSNVQVSACVIHLLRIYLVILFARHKHLYHVV